VSFSLFHNTNYSLPDLGNKMFIDIDSDDKNVREIDRISQLGT